MNKKWFLATVLSMFIASLVLSSFTFAPAAMAKGKTPSPTTKIKLAASEFYPKAKGTAKIKEVKNKREFQVEVEHVKSLAGQTLSVFLDGSLSGTFTINGLGAGKLTLRQQRGNTVPVIVAGSTVEIRTDGGVLVASGQY